MPYSRLFVILLLALAFVAVRPAAAQENLLSNPGFELEGNWTPVQSGGGGVFSAPPHWGGWYDSSSATVPNGYPHRRAFPPENPTEEEIGVINGVNMFIRTGNFSANFGRGGGAFTAAIYQQANVAEGENLLGSAWVIMNLPAGANFQARVGIDPNGGTNPGDTDIVWSEWGINTIGSFRQLTASATATGTTATLFLYFRTLVSVDPNGIHWDDAFLGAGGSGGAAPGAATAAPANTPVPTAPPAVAFVVPQGAQADGSIVHTVQSGDTLNSIAVAYGVLPDEIIALNNIADPRLLRVGQQLVIKEAAGSNGGGEETEPNVETEEPPSEETSPPSEETEPNDNGEDQPTQVAAQPTARPTERPMATAEPTNTVPAPVAVADSSSSVDPANMSTSVCVMLFEDANTNRVQDGDESGLAGGTIDLAQNGVPMDSFVTDGSSESFCFDDLEAGEYVAVATVPQGYGLTTADQRRLRLQAGTTLNVSFGAAQGFEVMAPPPAESADLAQVVADEPEEDDTQQLLQYIGLIVFALAAVTLAGGVGVALALRRR